MPKTSPAAAGRKWLACFTPFFSDRERRQAGCQHRLFFSQVEFYDNLIFHRRAALDKLGERLLDAIHRAAGDLWHAVRTDRPGSNPFVARRCNIVQGFSPDRPMRFLLATALRGARANASPSRTPSSLLKKSTGEAVFCDFGSLLGRSAEMAIETIDVFGSSQTALATLTGPQKLFQQAASPQPSSKQSPPRPCGPHRRLPEIAHLAGRVPRARRQGIRAK